MLVLALLALGFLLRDRLDRELAMTIAVVLCIGVPFLLPRMHERYFFLADIFTLCWACSSLRRVPAAALAERAFVRHLGGGCTSPVAAYAVCEGEELVLTGLYYSKESGFKPAGTDGCGRAVIRDYYTGTMRGKRSEAGELGRKLAEKMRGGNCL